MPETFDLGFWLLALAIGMALLSLTLPVPEPRKPAAGDPTEDITKTRRMP